MNELFTPIRDEGLGDLQMSEPCNGRVDEMPVAIDIGDVNDTNAFYSMVQAPQVNLVVRIMKVLADKGCHNRAQFTYRQ